MRVLRKRQYAPLQRELDLGHVQEELLRLVGISNGTIVVLILTVASQELRLWPLLRAPAAIALSGLVFFACAQVARLTNHQIAFWDQENRRPHNKNLGKALNLVVHTFAILAAITATVSVLISGVALWRDFPISDPETQNERHETVITNNN